MKHMNPFQTKKGSANPKVEYVTMKKDINDKLLILIGLKKFRHCVTLCSATLNLCSIRSALAVPS